MLADFTTLSFINSSWATVGRSQPQSQKPTPILRSSNSLLAFSFDFTVHKEGNEIHCFSASGGTRIAQHHRLYIKSSLVKLLFVLICWGFCALKTCCLWLGGWECGREFDIAAWLLLQDGIAHIRDILTESSDKRREVEMRRPSLFFYRCTNIGLTNSLTSGKTVILSSLSVTQWHNRRTSTCNSVHCNILHAIKIGNSNVKA